MEYREVRLDVFLKFLEQERGYQLISSLGSGSFGDVYKMREPRKNKDVAVKLVVYFEEDSHEETLWAKLDYKYILPLYDVIHMDEFSMSAFVMPLQERSLHATLKDPAFRGQKGSLECTKRWLYQVLKAMEYLASKRMCHLDIKGDNVLISGESKALLCDFSFINSSKELVDRERVGLPYKYRPPELCYTRYPGEVKGNGELIDLWSFGAMALQLLTGFPIRSRGRAVETWETDVYPLFWTALQEDRFFRNLSRTFPSDPIAEGEKRLALDFVHGFLMTYDLLRVRADFAKTHSFLNKGKKCFKQKDCIWRPNEARSSDLPETETTEDVPVEVPDHQKPSENGAGKYKKGILRRLMGGAWKRVRSFFNRKEETPKVLTNNNPQNSIKDPQIQLEHPSTPVIESHSNPPDDTNSNQCELQLSFRYASTLKDEKTSSSNDPQTELCQYVKENTDEKPLGVEEEPIVVHTCNAARSARYITPYVLQQTPVFENTLTTHVTEKTSESCLTSPRQPPEDSIETVVKDILDSIVSIIALEPESRQHDDTVEEFLKNHLSHPDVVEKYLEGTSDSSKPLGSPAVFENELQIDDRVVDFERPLSEKSDPLTQKREPTLVHLEISKQAEMSANFRDGMSFTKSVRSKSGNHLTPVQSREKAEKVPDRKPTKKTTLFWKFGPFSCIRSAKHQD